MLAIGSPDDPADNPRVTDLSRYADFLAFLDEQHAADPDLRAAWVGGSAATGGYDEWSDLDVEVLCTPGTYLDVYRRLLAAIRERFAPPDVWELLESTYPDGRQCFVALDPVARRPGGADPAGRLRGLGDDRRAPAQGRTPARLAHRPLRPGRARRRAPRRRGEDVGGRSRSRWRRSAAQRPFGEWLVNRAIERGHLPEAVSLYLRFALQPAVYLVRVRDCYARHNFGLRYLDTDIDPGDAARVDALLPGVERLRELSAECFAWQDELLASAG